MNEDGNVCIGIGYKWAVYGDILSLLVSVDFDWDATEYTIYNINLKRMSCYQRTICLEQ